MKVGVLITARLKSTRLPLKVLKPIKGRPMIGHLIDRLKLAKKPRVIALITSPLEADRPLVELAAREGIECHCGDPDDVLLRIKSAAEAFDLDLAVSCTGDNPFVDPVQLDRLVDFHMQRGDDFSMMEGVPWGAFSYAISYDALVKACEIKDEVNTEVWGGYFTQTGLFKCGKMQVDDPAVHWPELRLTVDTPEDFELVSRVFDELHRPGEVFSLEQIVALCRRRPDLVAINQAVRQAEPIPIKLKVETDGSEKK